MMLDETVLSLFAVPVLIVLLISPAAAELKSDNQDEIKAFCIDFNWGAAGFARPGLWADASPEEHVGWYKVLGVNTIQTFCVSCNGYAWYKGGFVNPQPGLKHDFLPEMVKLGHQEGMRVMGYFCVGANRLWGKTHPDLSYGTRSEPHIPFTTEYLDYLCASIKDAIEKTGIDGFMIDWVWKASGRWLDCEQVMYEELMDEPFPGADKINDAKLLQFNRRAIDRSWTRIHETAKSAKPDCIIWLSCNDLAEPTVAGSKMFREIDWLMNEHPDPSALAKARKVLGPQGTIVQCICGWGPQHDAEKIIRDTSGQDIGYYGFAKPGSNSLPRPIAELKATELSDLSGNDKSIEIMRRYFHGEELSDTSAPGNPEPPAIIPAPVELTVENGYFELKPETAIVVDEKTDELGRQLADALQPATGYSLQITTERQRHATTIHLSIDPGIANLGDEGYSFQVTPASIAIRAPKEAGIFYGIQTLRQLFPPQIFSGTPVHDVRWMISCLRIKDYPQFEWRGMHLDVARHFMPKEFVMKLIDLLALHKMNSLHLHLTDDQGWRIEIKRYPKLTEIGAWRDETIVGHASQKPHKFDGKRHGGYYTQEDIREIVAYAAQRYINIVPEVEMPGHAQAAIAAYPELGNTGESLPVRTFWGVNPNIFNANEDTIVFLRNVLTEVLDLFPSPYIHVGGDEAVKDQWEQSPEAQARINELGLKDEDELQSYFIKRMDVFLSERGRRLIGWDEILEGGLAPGATVMSWRGTEGGIKAAKMGHDVVMAPTTHTYFDYYQSKNRKKEPLAIGGYLPLEKVYDFDPVPDELTEEEAKHILGAQGQIWTEYISTPKHAEYMAFPRAAALFEVVWTPAEKKDYADFLKRLRVHLKRLDSLNVNYRPLDKDKE